MTKLFIENGNNGASAQIRIYPLDENSQVITPDSFTPMDDLGLSFGIALLPRPAIECSGVVARSGGIILDGDGEFTVTTDDGEVTTIDKAEMIQTLEASGYQVNVLPRWTGGQIICDGGTTESGWYIFPDWASFELAVDGEVIGSDFYLSLQYSDGGDLVKRELNKRGLDIEFEQELG